ncbi:MAG TPA: hypothetical protein VIP09_08710 [Dehalococcoidia bacterium]
MPKPTKKAHEMTTDELAHRVFPHKVVQELRRVANPEPKPRSAKPARSSHP